MDRQLLEDLLSVLKDIRAGKHGKVDKRARRQLKQVIRQLEEALYSDDKKRLTAFNVLTLLGGIVEKIPGIVELIDKLTKK